MDPTNLVRDFGADLALLALVAVPAGAIAVGIRARFLRRAGSTTPLWVASSEVLLLGYVLAVAVVTLTPKAYVDLQYQPRIEWSLWESDLTYGPERAQLLGNLLLLVPVPILVLARFRPRKQMLVGLAVSALVPLGIEGAQAFAVRGRVAALEDVLVGAAGGALATLIVVPASRLLQRRASSIKGVERDEVDALDAIDS
ncbi:VanZ family protein [Nocardioides sp. GCM10030258]|uniref:VanZ family protein n=1 Tax=unclassified Nocardioides TaxID=2615069 RepID=UPI00361292F4